MHMVVELYIIMVLIIGMVRKEGELNHRASMFILIKISITGLLRNWPFLRQMIRRVILLGVVS
ncbi:hypothetical protein D3C72_2600430 [compost metagenome]